VHDHLLFEHAFDGRVETRQQWRMFPSVRRDLIEHVQTGKAVREQPVEQRVQLGVRQSLLLPLVHVSRFASSDGRTQP
jgi:hypothetical protein